MGDRRAHPEPTPGSASPRCHGSAPASMAGRGFAPDRYEHTEFPYAYLDATYLNVRNQTSQVVSMAVVVATRIASDGSREVLGVDVAARTRRSGAAS